MKKRTYKNPGFCIKCNGENVILAWTVEKTADRFGNLPIDHLEATCTSCYFAWTVAAKDELSSRENKL